MSADKITSSETPRDCKHGQLARSCELCELERENAALREQLAERDAELAALKGRIKQIEREHKDAMRDVAAEASRAARFPDEPYGTY